jgi:hypothetical protein
MPKELLTYLTPFAIPIAGGLIGTLLEALGERWKLPKLVAIGQRVEAILFDAPKAIRGSRMTRAVQNVVGDTKNTEASNG